MTRPAELPEWATSGANILEPPSGKKAAGFLPGERPPAAWFNWWKNLVFEWVKFLDEELHTIGSARMAAMQVLNSIEEYSNTGDVFNAVASRDRGTGSDEDFFAVGNNGTRGIWAYSVDGRNWQPYAEASGNNVWRAVCFGPIFFHPRYLVVGDNGAGAGVIKILLPHAPLFAATNVTVPGSPTVCSAVLSTHQDHTWLVLGNAAYIARSTTTSDPPVFSVVSGAAGFSGDFTCACRGTYPRVLIGGANSEIQASDDHGATWTRCTVPGGAAVNAIHRASSGVLIAITADYPLRSIDNGDTWEAPYVTLDAGGPLTAIASVSRAVLLSSHDARTAPAVATDKVFVSLDEGETFPHGTGADLPQGFVVPHPAFAGAAQSWRRNLIVLVGGPSIRSVRVVAP